MKYTAVHLVVEERKIKAALKPNKKLRVSIQEGWCAYSSSAMNN